MYDSFRTHPGNDVETEQSVLDARNVSLQLVGILRFPVCHCSFPFWFRWAAAAAVSANPFQTERAFVLSERYTETIISSRGLVEKHNEKTTQTHARVFTGVLHGQRIVGICAPNRAKPMDSQTYRYQFLARVHALISVLCD